MSINLTASQFANLIQKVFAPVSDQRTVCLLVDVPNARTPDNTKWQDRRAIAFEWFETLTQHKDEVLLDAVYLLFYENVGNNNAELPDKAYDLHGEIQELDINRLRLEGQEISLPRMFPEVNMILALTEFSATAPLKILAPKYGFKAATMPGFSREMIPALELDYEAVHKKVMAFKDRLDRASGIKMRFFCVGKTFSLFIDLRSRIAHASSGLLREGGCAGNLPSGEAYIVPYEGELDMPSETSGQLPVQFENEVVVYEIENNRAVRVLSHGSFSDKERKKLAEEPAYGNLAEIGFGVLGSFGIQPIGEVLLDEKLGLHIAFGRSDHFGGSVGPDDFRIPENVVHIDRIYIPEVQDKVRVEEVVLFYSEGEEVIMRDNSSTI